LVLLQIRYRPIGVRDRRPMRGHPLWRTLDLERQGGDRMRAKFSGWKNMLFSAAVLATLVLAAGARYKPK